MYGEFALFDEAGTVEAINVNGLPSLSQRPEFARSRSDDFVDLSGAAERYLLDGMAVGAGVPDQEVQLKVGKFGSMLLNCDNLLFLCPGDGDCFSADRG